MNDAFRMVQAQSDLMSDLPSIIAELQASVRGLSETLADSKTTAASALRVAARLEDILDEIEQPMRALRPGLQRLAAALDNPVIDRIPATLETIERTVLPFAARVAATTARMQETKARWKSRLARLRASDQPLLPGVAPSAKRTG
jgi:hypothetical protein